MFEFSLSGWQKTIGNLRGQGLMSDTSLQDLSSKAGETPTPQEFLRNYNTRFLDGENSDLAPREVEPPGHRSQVEPGNENTEALPLGARCEEDALKYQIAARRICSFAGRGEHYLELAYLAAFPLALTPDLLYYLRANFQFDCQGKSYDIPWLGIPDLLLSNLCQPRGYCLYEMDSAVRHLLLKHLKSNPRFGNERLNQLSDALLFYIWQKIPDGEAADFGENPRWIALAYTEPNELARQLALRLQQLYAGDKQDQIHAASLVATFSEPLAESDFQPLLTFARGLGRLARGNQKGADEQFNQLPAELTVAGVKLKNPGVTKLPTFEFEVVTVNSRGEIVTRERKQASYFTEDLGNNISLEMVAIPGGTFLMGSPETEAERYEYEEPQHLVSVPSFFMGKYQITQAQWQAVAALPKINRDLESDPSYFKGENRPVENVSWLDAVEFCARLSQKTKREYRLPSEAEWEYACRAGTTTPFHFGETITPDLVNYNGNFPHASA
ncbi:formylglycine-generating enzyme family protein, partial [Microseira wollei]|uniref:formylglycine-generating enzyme family protein n=1 Tax=Microseira wollei TaxID=467598 RepID=UPI001CFF44AA